MEPRAVSATLIAKVVLVTAAVIGALYFLLFLIFDVVGLLFIAVFFALAISLPVNWLDQRGVPRWIAILLVYLAIAAGIFGIGLLIVPPLVDGVDGLSQDLPGYVEDLRDNETFREYDDRYDITEKLTEQAEGLPTQLGDAAGTLRDVTVGVFSRFVQLFSILVITFFLLMDGKRMLNWFFDQLPRDRRDRLRRIADDAQTAITGYVFGNVLISILAGIVTYITLSILDVPFAVPLAIMFGFFDLVPLVGATIGGILVGIVVAFVDFPTGLVIWIAVLVLYQQVENNIIQPLIYKRTVELHPLIVIIAILIGASLLGVLGALVAIPIAATIQSIAKDLYTYRRADRARREEPPEPPAPAGPVPPTPPGALPPPAEA
jgi:predicted PurR-regulated permease PerM